MSAVGTEDFNSYQRSRKAKDLSRFSGDALLGASVSYPRPGRLPLKNRLCRVIDSSKFEEYSCMSAENTSVK